MFSPTLSKTRTRCLPASLRRKNNLYKLALEKVAEDAMTCACKMQKSRHGFAASFVWSLSNWTSGGEDNGRRRKRVISVGVGFRWWLERPACRVRQSWRDLKELELSSKSRAVSASRVRSPGWRTPDTDPIRSGFVGSLGAVDRPRDARRPHVSLAMDLQEHGQAGRGIDATESPRVAIARSRCC